MSWHPDVSALILAGGKATRLGGVAKHELVVDGQTIFARQVALLAPRVTEIIVSLPAPLDEGSAAARAEPYAGAHRIARDRHAGIGPLAGIAAGMSESRTNWLLVVAGDMPHLSGDLLDRMLLLVEEALVQEMSPEQREEAERQGVVARPGEGAVGLRPRIDAVGVRAEGLPEPLLCVLHRRVLTVVEARIAAGRYKASGLLTDEGLYVAWLDDADPAALRNVNSPEDL